MPLRIFGQLGLISLQRYSSYPAFASVCKALKSRWADCKIDIQCRIHLKIVQKSTSAESMAFTPCHCSLFFLLRENAKLGDSRILLSTLL